MKDEEDVESGDTLVKGRKKRGKVSNKRLWQFVKPLLWPEGRPKEKIYMVLSLLFLVISRVIRFQCFKLLLFFKLSSFLIYIFLI